MPTSTSPAPNQTNLESDEVNNSATLSSLLITNSTEAPVVMTEAQPQNTAENVTSAVIDLSSNATVKSLLNFSTTITPPNITRTIFDENPNTNNTENNSILSVGDGSNFQHDIDDDAVVLQKKINKVVNNSTDPIRL